MGINNFHSWINKQYNSSVKYKWLQTYDNVYIDLNYALHYVASTTDNNSEELIYEKLYDFISDMLQLTEPQKKVILASDGIPPISKLSLQRKRRLEKSQCTNNDLKFNTIQFTPGTKFMETLEIKMKPYFDKLSIFYNIPINTYQKQ